MKFLGQKNQDRWVVDVFGPMRGGYFLDLAASDGITINNTFVLERDLGWTGIAIEAEPNFYSALARNRSCLCVNACVDGAAHEVEFLPEGEHGGIVDTDTDNSPTVRASKVAQARQAGETFTIRTRTLAEILESASAPPVIDYFSFDVEGAETRILRSFPFDKYRFLTMTIERPTPELNATLFGNGYAFVGNINFDTFYVHRTLPNFDAVPKRKFSQVPAKGW